MTNNLRPTMKGSITRRISALISCGLCANKQPLYQGNEPYSLLAATMKARELGWHKSLSHGWICPGPHDEAGGGEA